MPADIALPFSVSTNAPDVDFGLGRDSVVNQSVGDQKQAFNQEYQRQVDARNEHHSRQKIQESRQNEARQANDRADDKASQRADRQEDIARRAEQSRRDEHVRQTERRNQQQESGKRLPESGNERARQVAREGERAQHLASQKATRQDQVSAEKNRVDSSRREGAQEKSQQVQQTQSKQTELQAAQAKQLEAQQQTQPKQTESQAGQAKQLETQQQTQKAQQLQHQNAQHMQVENQKSDSVIAANAGAELVDEARLAADDMVLSPYILQQLSETGATSTVEVADALGAGLESGLESGMKPGLESGSERGNSISPLAQWMEQTLGVDQSTANNNASKVLDGAVDTASVDTNVDKGAISTVESTMTKVLEPEVSSVSPEDILGIASGKAHDLAMPSDVIVKPSTVEGESAKALRNMDDVARLLDAKRLAEPLLEKALPESKIQPLSQAIESINRSDRLAEPTFLKQAALSSEAPSNGLSLDELKQMMQERKVLLEGGRLEGGAATLKAGAEDVPQADKLLALDKRLSQGMDGLRQLRIPGQEAKKASVEDSVKPSSFGRALEQMSSIKTEEGKPLSTSIATPMNKPGFIPEFNQRIMMMIGQKIQSAEIKLNPEELGSIDVSIKFNQDQQASIVFASQHSVTRDALEQGAQRLRDMLEQNGVDVDNVDIQENLTHERHDKGADDDRGVAKNAKDQEGISDTAEDVDGQVATIETDSLVDFYA
ncbi:MAG: flagellar hook-length control protein FliK [Pseudomonadales bacterium]|nr:flagellar hook-length control protein FliK [Pseudomonadales bacterium]